MTKAVALCALALAGAVAYMGHSSSASDQQIAAAFQDGFADGRADLAVYQGRLAECVNATGFDPETVATRFACRCPTNRRCSPARGRGIRSGMRPRGRTSRR
jgi:hypothetical protein